MADRYAVLTITGTLGPNNAVTSMVFQRVKEVAFELAKAVIKIVYTPPNSTEEKIQYFDYAITATVTYTISGNVATITIA